MAQYPLLARIHVRFWIFTDSRGQHKPRGSTHRIFAERLSDNPDFQVQTYLCPMKWTTTLDFPENSSAQDLAKYHHVILSIRVLVDWSPRKLSKCAKIFTTT